MHQSMDRERDRQMERRRACEKTWILTHLEKHSELPALSFGEEHTDKGCSDSAFAARSGRMRSNRKPRKCPRCSAVTGVPLPPPRPLPARGHARNADSYKHLYPHFAEYF